MSRWLRGQLDKFAKHQVKLLEESVTEFLLDTVGFRSVSVFFDPILAHALLGKEKAKSVFPPLSEREDFRAKGYDLDPAAIAQEIRRLLYSGTVKMSRMDVCRGEGDTLSFSPAFHSTVINSLSEGTRSMLEDYRRARISSEIRSRAAAMGTGTFVTHHPDTS